MSNNFENIDSHSQKVLNYLKANHRDFIEKYNIEKNEYFEGNYLAFKFFSQKNIELNLELNTSEEELTVVFEDFHWHFNRYTDSDFESEIGDAIRLIKEIQNEDFVILKLLKGKAFYKSKLIRKNEIIALIKNDSLKHNLDWWETVKIESYKGTYDRIFTK